ncbi:MAG: aminoacyl-tRNA hydrolase [SAR202 cluster bacterium]|nr:aminoacyl-tRNA hydrolase [SAR202 cluster bacterium]
MTSSPGGGLWMIVGLGNPGPRYEGTRHNVGFMVVDMLAQRHGIRLNDRREHAIIGEGTVGGAKVVLAKPRTFMNESGVAVKYLRQRFGGDLSRLVVIIDDMDLPLGKLRLRASGSSGGHNGLNSINAHVGSQTYPRLRFGVGRPVIGAIDHVLGRFDKREAVAVVPALERAAEAVEACISHGIDYAMNRFN